MWGRQGLSVHLPYQLAGQRQSSFSAWCRHIDSGCQLKPDSLSETWFPEALFTQLAADMMPRLTPKQYRGTSPFLAQSAGSLNLLPLPDPTTFSHAQPSADCWVARTSLPLG